MRKIWINCGELSGDIQSAELVKALKKTGNSFDFVGMGGDSLKREGLRTLFHINELSVMGISEVIEKLPHIVKLVKRIGKALEEEKPDALIVTDAPDFNFRIIKYAKKLGIPVYYFIPPKVWAWRQYRIKFLHENVKKIYSILPFEVDFYKQHKMDITYIGNPLVNIVNPTSRQDIVRDKNCIGLMPGSRKKEVSSLLPEFAIMAKMLQEQYPSLTFNIIKAPHFSKEYLKSFWTCDVPVNFIDAEKRYDFIASCNFIVGASGTAVLETALLETPTIVTYKVKPFSYMIGKLFVNVDFVSLPNLIVQHEVFPELLQDKSTGKMLYSYAKKWLDNPEYLSVIQNECLVIKERCGNGDSATIFANDFCKELGFS